MKSQPTLKQNCYKKLFIGLCFSIIFSCCYYLEQDWHERRFVSKMVQVIDGDTIILNNLRIRLQGIDAPELKQQCQNIKTMKFYNCGIAAKEYLIELIRGKEIACTDEGIDKYKRQLSYCYLKDLNINREMIKRGHAIAYLRYDKYFLLDEIEAKWNKAGIWSTKFVIPELWRKSKKTK